ncbi:hypothetical protein JHK82_042084 [Glycine max]|nr:hypothetical protein JHK82_042084 [Glycine max]
MEDTKSKTIRTVAKALLSLNLSQFPILGQGFASGLVNLGEIQVSKVTRFEFISSSSVMLDNKKSCYIL